MSHVPYTVFVLTLQPELDNATEHAHTWILLKINIAHAQFIDAVVFLRKVRGKPCYTCKADVINFPSHMNSLS